MHTPSGREHKLLTPYDERQSRGNAPSLYPWRQMEVGDWFVVPEAYQDGARRVRSAATSHRGYGNAQKRFAVRQAAQFGPGAVICVRTH